MQATTCVHDSIPEPVLQETDGILYDPVTFHSTNGVFNADADGGHATIRGFLRGCQFSSRGLFLGLNDRDVLQGEPLEALILIQTAPHWQGIARQLGQALLRGFAFRGVTQKAHVTRLRDHQEIFARVTRLLAAVIVFLLFGIGRALDRTFSAIRPKRGVVELPSAVCVSNIAANSSAVRAGSRAGSAKA
jgi:hypothetical protein